MISHPERSRRGKAYIPIQHAMVIEKLGLCKKSILVIHLTII